MDTTIGVSQAIGNGILDFATSVVTLGVHLIQANAGITGEFLRSIVNGSAF